MLATHEQARGKTRNGTSPRSMAVLTSHGARHLLAGFLLALATVASGCAVVRPWEREILAKPVMQLDRDPTEVRLREGLLGYREGSTGALGSSGGGCGCD